jgi:glycosyltransferase involved in cell wall biosynthesis
MDYFANVDGIRWFCKEVLPIVRACRPDVVFQIVGGYPTKEVQQLAIPDHVDVTGFVEDVRPYLRAATAVVVPLQVGGGTRLKILEALAMGKVVVTTSIGTEGIKAIPGEEILVADHPGEFAKQIVRALNNPALRSQVGIAGRRLVEKRYSWEKIGECLEEVYQSACPIPVGPKERQGLLTDHAGSTLGVS